MKKIVLYLVILLLTTAVLYTGIGLDWYPKWIQQHLFAIKCSLSGLVGGILYCLRGVYLNKCVRNDWNDNWQVWYYVRPLTSLISGWVAFVFLKAGLLALDAGQDSESGIYGFIAFSFVAGLNVDKFIGKVEEIAKTSFGIEKSRANDILGGKK